LTVGSEHRAARISGGLQSEVRRHRLVRLLTGGLLALGLAVPTLLPADVATADEAPRDIARDGTAVAASEYPDSTRFAARFAIDGDPGTRWGSDYVHGDEEPAPPSDHDPTRDWIHVELAEPSPVHKVVFDWQTARPAAFAIQTSLDGEEWTTVRTVSNPAVGRNEHVLDITEPVGFVRMQGIEPATRWGYSLWSFEIWDRVEPVPDPTGWDYGTDVARGGVATAASVFTGDPTKFAPWKAIDGDATTRWGSDYARGPEEPPGSDHDPSRDWLQVELAEPSPVWSVVLNWETARPAKFRIQTSQDGERWTTAREVTSPPVGITEYPLAVKEAVRFVRMQGVEPATRWGYSLWSFEVWSGPQAPPEPGGTVLPAPVSQTELDGEPFAISKHTRVLVNDNAVRPEAELLASQLRTVTGYPVPVAHGQPKGSDITLVLGAEEAPADDVLEQDEGYTLRASADGVRIGAASDHGLFNGTRTLLQLLPAEVSGDAVRPGPWVIGATEIVDYPRFSHRGVMLDPARNFIEVDGVLGVIDALADMKGNRLHMHLSDDQGWRIEIESWPKLAEVGGSMSRPGGKTGFYTQEEFARIVAYADARHIEVIPEFDVPGHSSAAIAAYPELACGSSNTVCTTSPVVDDFLNDVIGEIAPMTNSDLFHIGGDESISGQPYIDFVKKVEGFVMDHGKRMVGWSPVPMAGLDESSVHHYWRDQSYEMTPEWFAGGNDVILSPTSKAYLDYPYPQHNSVTTYDWDPSNVVDDYRGESLQSYGLRDEDILGIEGPAWGEHNTGGIVDVEHKVFPRLAAILDLAWSPQEKTTDPRSFLQRLGVQGSRWQFAGTNFWPDPLVEWTTTVAGTVHSTPRNSLAVSGPVASVASPTYGIEDLTATIDWGDGTTSAGTLSGSAASGKRGNSLYEVIGEHRYSADGKWSGTVTVTASDGQTWTVGFTARTNS